MIELYYGSFDIACIIHSYDMGTKTASILLENIWKKLGKTLVVITHDSRIARMADRQFVIVDGVLSEVTAK